MDGGVTDEARLADASGIPKLADVAEAQGRVSLALALSIDYYDTALHELRQAVLELNAKVPELEANVARLERLARNDALHRRAQ